MVTSSDKTVAEYVTENIKTAHIFKKYGIDFCCGGNVSLTKACAQKNVDINDIEKELSEIGVVKDLIEDYDKWELDFLIIYIENVHHTYVRENLPLISQYANKVAKVHETRHPEVVEINNLFHEIANELIIHLEKEEQVLFPFIRQLFEAKKQGTLVKIPPFNTVNNPIRMMEYEHENAGDILKQIASLTNNYTPPTGACNTHKALYAKLEEFEQDLHKHIHLENNILHRKAISLEKELRASQNQT
ncbi:Nitric oxide-dependent regulator DnrN or NorA [Tenacibaculum sp. 190130A14a]|uniref:Regulator of cell morphogenesis and NO signaling n=1 Tax=Tenacibaculum polynesiense TaxID=3137857 RepID=A0ABP1ERN7_9FLAO